MPGQLKLIDLLLETVGKILKDMKLKRLVYYIKGGLIEPQGLSVDVRGEI
jgi:hypothetical protein